MNVAGDEIKDTEDAGYSEVLIFLFLMLFLFLVRNSLQSRHTFA